MPEMNANWAPPYFQAEDEESDADDDSDGEAKSDSKDEEEVKHVRPIVYPRCSRLQ